MLKNNFSGRYTLWVARTKKEHICKICISVSKSCLKWSITHMWYIVSRRRDLAQTDLPFPISLKFRNINQSQNEIHIFQNVIVDNGFRSFVIKENLEIYYNTDHWLCMCFKNVHIRDGFTKKKIVENPTKKKNKKNMDLKHWMLPSDHFKTHLFFQFLGDGPFSDWILVRRVCQTC